MSDSVSYLDSEGSDSGLCSEPDLQKILVLSLSTAFSDLVRCVEMYAMSTWLHVLVQMLIIKPDSLSRLRAHWLKDDYS